MKGDFTRFTFKPQKHYTSVLMQQGRVQLDADWNEQANIHAYFNQSVAKDMIGDSGAAKSGSGFEIQPINNSTDLLITPGHIYVNGILCELEDISNNASLEKEVKYTTQPDYPNPEFTKKGENSQKLQLALQTDKHYLAYLDVWQRHISAIEDKDIREIALQGSDTATRTKTVWQVKLLEVENDISKHNWHTSENWKTLIQKRDVSLNVDDTNASGGEGGWQNKLYRIEIHKQGGLGEATFKYSSNNGAILFPIKEIKSNYIEISNFSRDISDSFKNDQWVEITNDIRELQGEPGTLVQLSKTSGNKLFFNPATIVNNSSDSQTFPQKHNLKVRSWDSKAAIIVESEVSLENGIKLKFAGDAFKTGDYWLIPTRKVEVNKHHIQWTFDSSNNPIPQPPEGIEHHYSPLALLSYENNQLNLLKDLRKTFPSLSNCLDKTGDVMTGALEIQDNLYITGKSNQDNQYIPGKVGIGTKEPEQRLVIIDIDNYKGRVGIGYNDTEQTAALAIKDNVGIGTFTPQQKLVILEKDDNKAKVAIGYNQTEQTVALAIKDNVGIGYYKLPDTTALAIKGKVGINTILPKSDLSVSGNVAIGSTNYTEVAKAPDNGLIVEGNVGIGTPNPTSAKLEVNGDVKISNSVAISKGGLTIGELNQIEEGSLKVSKNAFLATTSGKVGIATQEIHENTLLGIAGSTSIGSSSYVKDKIAPENGLLVEGKVNINGIPENNQLAENAQLYTQGDAYISNKVYTTDLSVTGNIELGELTQLSLTELKVKKNAFLATTQNSQVSIGSETKPNQTLFGIAGNTTIGSSYINSKAAPENGLLVEGKVNIGDTVPRNNPEAEDAQLYTQGDAYIDGTLYTKDLNITDSIEFAESTQLSIAELKIRKNTFLATTKENQVSIGSERKPNANTLLGIAGNTIIGESYISSKAAPENGLLVEGKVSIGGTVPRNNEARDSQLYVKGNAYINGTSFVDTIVFNEFMQRSSQQYKDNIAELSIQESLQILEDLKPVKYSYRTDETKRIHAGFIAEKSPEIFTSTDKTMLNSTGIIAILTNVLKEHIHTNSALNRVISNQQKEISNLRERVRKLEENNQKFFW